jgi:hypothetical protein
LVYEAGYFYDPKNQNPMFNRGLALEGVWVGDLYAGGK